MAQPQSSSLAPTTPPTTPPSTPPSTAHSTPPTTPFATPLTTPSATPPARGLRYEELRREILILAAQAYPIPIDHPPDVFRIDLRFVRTEETRGMQCVLSNGRWGKERKELACGEEFNFEVFHSEGSNHEGTKKRDCLVPAMKSLRDVVADVAKKEQAKW